MTNNSGSSQDVMAKLVRDTHIVENIVFLDGLTGTGKTMLAPILGSYKRVELGRLEHIYEYLCILDSMGKIDQDAGDFMIRTYADLALYNSMISRETNFRITDLSGVFGNPNSFRYVRRLFCNDGNVVLDRIRKTNPILHIISHQALCVMDLAFRAFDKRLRIIEMVRHPLYLLEHWYSYIDRHGTDCRDFSVWLGYRGYALPWFAKGWEEQYVKANSMDKVIYSIQWLTQKMDEVMAVCNEEQKKQVLFIPFEKFVLKPGVFLTAIGELLGTEVTTKTWRILKKQKCPRNLVTAGPAKEIYKRYAWKKPDKGASEKGVLEQKRVFAEERASKEALQVLDFLCKDYEKKYGIWF